jgi:hypothetical protein
MSSKIQYLPAKLAVVLVPASKHIHSMFLILTRISDIVEGIRLNGHTWWSIAWWLPRIHNSEEVLKLLWIATPSGGRSLYDLLETLSPEELGKLDEYGIATSATIEKMMIAIIKAEPDQRLAMKVELLDWIVQHGFYTYAIAYHELEGKCLVMLEEPLLKSSATKILNHIGYTAESIEKYGPPHYGK